MNADKTVTCPYCDGVGTIEDGKGRERTCKSCEGRGVVKLVELAIYDKTNSNIEEE